MPDAPTTSELFVSGEAGLFLDLDLAAGEQSPHQGGLPLVEAVLAPMVELPADLTGMFHLG